MKKNDEKVDIIITWLDGNDIEWQKEKNKYLNVNNDSEVVIDNSNRRYRDWDNLKYIFRGIENFMPWVNNVFLVTNGQLPKWINLNCEKLRWIKHEDYMPKEFLPTFNSIPIEMNFHRIEELSECFIFFNDDMFVLKNIKKEDFFKNGLPCEQAILNPVTPDGNDIISRIWFNNTCIINKYFNKKETLKKYRGKFINLKYGKDLLRTLICLRWNKFLGFKVTHFPAPLLKSVFKEIWNKENEELTESSMHKFRSKDDYNQYLIKEWQLVTGRFNPRNSDIGKVTAIKTEKDVDRVKKMIESNKYKTLCINDDIQDGEKFDFERAKQRLNESFEKVLPKKSKFEI